MVVNNESLGNWKIKNKKKRKKGKSEQNDILICFLPHVKMPPKRGGKKSQEGIK
jgi:hypothetical protein